MDDLKVLLWPLVAIFVLFVVGIIFFALRNKVLFKMGARNLPRRKANAVLTVLGLMLAAMIFSASFATGDTLTYSIRSIAVDYVGQVDEMVMMEGSQLGGQAHSIDGATRIEYFPESALSQVENALSDLRSQGIVEGIAPVILESNVPVIAQTTSLNEPQVSLLAFDHQYMSEFDTLLTENGETLSLENLGDGEVYINVELAKSLSDENQVLGIGDTIDVFLSNVATPLIVAGIYESGGNPIAFSFDGNASMVMSLNYLQDLRGSDDINFILITNKGGAITGASHTEAVMAALEPALEGTSLKVEPVKQDILDEADAGGAGFSTVFLIFGSFSIIAGVLLIFLIFVMLAAERKQELGMTRAIGAQRSHIVRMFSFEGILYALVASAVGAALGLVISWAMIQMMNAAFKEMGFDLVYHFTSSGLIISYTLGVVLTVLVVYFSARHVSRLNIISAIKDLPESRQEEKHKIRSLLITIIVPLIGLMAFSTGLQERIGVAYTLGGSLLIIGVFLVARKLRLPDRPAFTLAGIGLLVFWLIPPDWHPYNDEMSGGLELFIISGVMLVAGGVWVVMYNSDLLLRAIMGIFGRIGALAPILKPAVSYPMANRFRTGMALAMFSLIIFTLVVMAVINASFDKLLGDTERVSGGFDIRAEVYSPNPIQDIKASLAQAEGVSNDDFQAIAGFNIAPANMRNAGQGKEWEELFIAGADSEYTENVTYNFEIVTESDYKNQTSNREIWERLTSEPDLAILNSAIVSTRESGGPGGNQLDLRIGEDRFYLEDKYMPDDVYFEIQLPGTDRIRQLRVIGVADGMSGGYSPLVLTSQQTVNEFTGITLPPNAYRLMVTPQNKGNIPQIAKTLEQTFLENGMNTEVMAEEVKDFNKINNMFMNLMMAFMGLGLIVGIAALGVIAARSVVERRHQIGMLRAIGFRQGMIQASFLLESSFIAVLGILLGIGLGLALSYQLIPDWNVEGLTMSVPWAYIILIPLGAYLASLTTTFLPAYRAAKIYPAEALRYE